MRIVSAFYCSGERGSANLDIFSLIDELRKKHEIYLFLISRKRREKNLEYYEIEPFSRRRMAFFIFHILLLMREFKRIKPGIIISDSIFYISIPSYIMSRILKIPLAIYCREVILEKIKNGYLRKLLRFLRRFVLKKSELVVAIEEGWKQYFQREIGKEVYLIPASINLEKLELRNVRSELNLPINDKLILYMGTPSKYRRLDLLLTAFNRIRTENLKLVLAGSQRGNIEYLKNLIQELNLKESVILLPWLPYFLVPSLIYSCDVCVDPWPRSGIEESMYGLKILEYMAASKPILAIDIKGNRVIIKNGYNGVLAKPNVQDISEKLLLLLNDSDLSNKLGQNALKTIKEKYDSKLVADKFEELIKTEIGLLKK